MPSKLNIEFIFLFTELYIEFFFIEMMCVCVLLYFFKTY